MTKVKDDKWCFACGPENPHGLHLNEFRWEGKEYVVEFIPERHHQGWQGMTHGGIVATLLDEVMTRAIWEAGHEAVTAELTVRYHHPLPAGRVVQVRGCVRERRGRLTITEAKVLDAEGKVIASARGKFMQV